MLPLLGLLFRLLPVWLIRLDDLERRMGMSEDGPTRSPLQDECSKGVGRQAGRPVNRVHRGWSSMRQMKPWVASCVQSPSMAARLTLSARPTFGSEEGEDVGVEQQLQMRSAQRTTAVLVDPQVHASGAGGGSRASHGFDRPKRAPPPTAGMQSLTTSLDQNPGVSKNQALPRRQIRPGISAHA